MKASEKIEDRRRGAYVGSPKDPALAAKREKDWRKIVWRSAAEVARRDRKGK
jgi:hypothetical protein